MQLAVLIPVVHLIVLIPVAPTEEGGGPIPQGEGGGRSGLDASWVSARAGPCFASKGGVADGDALLLPAGVRVVAATPGELEVFLTIEGEGEGDGSAVIRVQRSWTDDEPLVLVERQAS